MESEKSPLTAHISFLPRNFSYRYFPLKSANFTFKFPSLLFPAELFGLLSVTFLPREASDPIFFSGNQHDIGHLNALHFSY